MIVSFLCFYGSASDEGGDAGMRELAEKEGISAETVRTMECYRLGQQEKQICKLIVHTRRSFNTFIGTCSMTGWP